MKISLAAQPEEYDFLAETSDPPTLAEFIEMKHPGYIDNFGMMSLGKLICDRENFEKILGVTWWLWDFSGLDTHMLLADRPCVFATELDDPHLVIALPITPSKAFMVTKSDRVASIIEQQHPRDLLIWINERTVMRAQRRVYARDASPRRSLHELLAKGKFT